MDEVSEAGMIIPLLIGILFLAVGLVDNLKYLLQARKMKRLKTSYLISRKFLIISFLSHVIGSVYVFPKGDLILNVTYLVGVATTAYALWVSYTHYPQRAKKKKRNMGVYVLDAFDLLSTQSRERYGFYSDRKFKQLAEELD